jgi:hypothetical protein
VILRRTSEHVREQNGFAVRIDFPIVLVGVFIGIRVMNWHGVRIDRVGKLGSGRDRRLQDCLPRQLPLPDLLA